MNARALLAELRAHRADPWIDAGRLRVGPPVGVLTPERRGAIAAHRDALLALLVAEADERRDTRLDGVFGNDGLGPERVLGLPGLRQAVPYGACLGCGEPCPADGQHWCWRCRTTGGTAA